MKNRVFQQPRRNLFCAYVVHTELFRLAVMIRQINQAIQIVVSVLIILIVGSVVKRFSVNIVLIGRIIVVEIDNIAVGWVIRAMNVDSAKVVVRRLKMGVRHTVRPLSDPRADIGIIEQRSTH